MTEHHSDSVASHPAALLGYAGLLPFAASALGIWLPATRGFAVISLLAYGAVILSFIGAVHWGVALTRPQATLGRYVFSVIPALIGWLAFMVAPDNGLVIIAIGILAVWLIERQFYAEPLPAWYRTLRLRLTGGVLLCLLVGWWGLQ